MPKPVFTLVIPTRNRAELAVTSLTRLLQQTWRDFEVVVLENSDQPCLSNFARRDPRIRVVPSARTLSMPDNWERGLDLACGEYVIYISDKDWLVPHALEELAAVVSSHARPALVNIRRAVWFPHRGLVMQQGSGQVATLPSGPVLDRWFESATNLMNAPMIYNSIVRRDFLDGLRRRYGGRFFYGNSPDVSSGLILLANTPSYVVLDRLHVMAVMGPWSIGWATIMKGQRGAAAGFAAEFGVNPVEAHGLVWSLTGVVSETLLACQRADPDQLGSFRINWSAYCELCRTELARRSAEGHDTGPDLVRLRSGIGRVYSRNSWFRGLAASRLRPRLNWLRHRTPLKIFFPPFDGWRRRLGVPPRQPGASSAVSYIDSACFRPCVAASTPEEAFAVLLRDQRPPPVYVKPQLGDAWHVRAEPSGSSVAVGGARGGQRARA